MIPWEYWGCFLMLGAAFVTDIKSMKIPNAITMTGVAAGLCYHSITSGGSGALFAIKGAGIGFALMFVLYLLRAVGGGDVKLFAGIGAWLGTGLTLSTMMYSIFAAGCIGLIIIIWRREALTRVRRVAHTVLGAVILRSVAPIKTAAQGQLQFPFMLAVLPGAIMSVYYF
ncbi:prepilin peptidase [Paenibacillus puldeungensis]|uniref:Prepilin peptidase n=1 Tax=Paenibacillus puldeungensis TaxID=696536 RepID=A0ABW3RRV8_9BACL